MAIYGTKTAEKRRATAEKYGLRVEAFEGDASNLSDLQKYYKNIGKRADNHIRSLQEAVAAGKLDKRFLEFAYQEAQYQLRKLGRKHFEVKPKTVEEAKALINQATKFLESPTASKAAINQMNKAKLDSINKTLGLTGKKKLSWSEALDLFDSGIFKDGTFTSPQIAEALAITREKGFSMEDIEKIRTGHLKVADEVLNEKIQEMIRLGFADDLIRK